MKRVAVIIKTEDKDKVFNEACKVFDKKNPGKVNAYRITDSEIGMEFLFKDEKQLKSVEKKVKNLSEKFSG